MSDRQHSLTFSLVFDAPPERIYAAWTDPSLIRWMGTSVEADPRVGGAYRREVLDATGARFVHAGRYVTLEPNRRIVQSFGLEGAQNNPFRDEEIEISLRPHGVTRTELIFTDRWNGPAMSPEEDHAAIDAWTAWLRGMERVL